MIWESGPWKKTLLEDADILERWATKTSRKSQQAIIFEKKILLAAYAMRKLKDADKICTALHHKKINFKIYERTNSKFTPSNWHHIDKHYNLNSKKSGTKGIWEVFDRIIHSHIFLLRFDDQENVDGFFIASDTDIKENNDLRFIDLGNFLKIVREIACDDPTGFQSSMDKDSKWYTKRWCSRHPL
ncbi:MAG: hypothetical protein KJ904_00335 [Alphaproteobacteria bacterium]|nr:hypothetical protein [Alphaproteobacteria bacterium]MBU0799078.1 hypothetical protein [Alphaproteobacteria bacterium]MBU0885590.1 hypothetical protein [Alphaproteobacteria bacterium]MBU1813755.1 hypothetical protein [Alphaproteobacteria bacterium]MBU2091432.1 hypothetical protein [Alphaproteobacteria bacterium]